MNDLHEIIYPEKYRMSQNFPFNAMKNVSTPLAFSIIAHHEVGLFEILLHLIFRPYNAYCIYVGSSSEPEMIEAIGNVVQCYQTLYPETPIFMAKSTSVVRWGQFSLLQADLNCMEQLLVLDQ